MDDLISRQKAIDVIKETIEEMRKNGTVHASFVQANGEMIIFGLEMALNMLQSLPSAQPEPCEDAVSRQQAIEVADAVWSVTGDKNVAKVWQQIKDLPPIQPEHRTGNWQDRRIIATNGNSLGIFRCSECKRASTITTAFCPNCGADMRI